MSQVRGRLRAAGLDPHMSTASEDKGIFGMRSTLLPGLGGQEHPYLHQFQAQLKCFAAGGWQLQNFHVSGGCSFDHLYVIK